MLVDGTRPASEPSLRIGNDGTVLICSPFNLGEGTDLWRSTDGGQSFSYVGQPVGVGHVVTRAGGGDVGGGDCDVAFDAANRAYLGDLWVGSVSISSSSDRAATWSGTAVSALDAPVDRPWLAGGSPNELYLTSAQLPGALDATGLPGAPAGGIWVARSTDSGKTFPQQTLVVSNSDRFASNGNIAVSGADVHVVYVRKIDAGMLALMVATSRDRGVTWTRTEVAQQPYPQGSCTPIVQFPAIASDRRGDVFLAWALQDPRVNRVDVFFAASPDRGGHWTTAWRVTDRDGSRAYPWIAASDGGQVGIVWYETNITALYKPDETQEGLGCSWQGVGIEQAAWHVQYAGIENALEFPPRIAEAPASGTVHVGTLGRPFAEVLQLAFDPAGRAATAFPAEDASGQPHPMFARQASAPSHGEGP